jgi:multidrug efflux system outer membrane protein
MSESTGNDTKTLILNAAEQSFADRGFDAASLRHIISEAGVNLAAVHYHFGSKEGLIRAVFARRLEPLNAERLQRLDAIEASGRRNPPGLEDVIRALIEPALRLARGGPEVMRLFGRAIAEPAAGLQELLQDQFGPVAGRFTGALARSCPELSPAVLRWRFHFMIGAMGHVMCDPTDMREFTGGLCDPVDTDEVVRQMTRFLAAGFRAPVEKRRARRPATRPAVKLALLGALLLTASACTSTPPASRLTVPEGWSGAARSGTPETEWWRAFGDDRLSALVEEALLNNRDLAAMRARVAATREQGNMVGAERWPTLEAQLSGGRQQQVFVGLPIPGATGPLKTRSSTRAFSLISNWELDLWGRVRSARQAAMADYLAATDDLRGARHSLAARIALSWIRVGEANEQLKVARSTAASHEGEFRFLDSRYRQGLRSIEVLRAAEAAGALANSQVKQWETVVAEERRRLEVLLGRYPAGEQAGEVILPALPAEVPAGLPADLLERRPDLQAARWRLEAAGFRLQAARAGLLPRFSLTASGGRSSDELRDLIDPRFSIWSVAANAAQPLFQGGRLHANVRLNRSRLGEATAAFDAAALAAFREVETALANEVLIAEREIQVGLARDRAASLSRLAVERYRLGLEDLSGSKNAERQALEARSRWVAVRRARLENRIALHLALGGGFAADAGEETEEP